MKRLSPQHYLLGLLVIAPSALASGSSIDKVYDPYVQLLEKEIEYRTRYEQDDRDQIDGRQRHILGYGQSLSDHLFAEIYMIGVDEAQSGFSIEDYEVELKWQLTEQGELDHDWGLLFELEKSREDDIWEAGSTLIVLREWGQWVATGNLSLIYEGGSDTKMNGRPPLPDSCVFGTVKNLNPAWNSISHRIRRALGPL
ncbi:MAG: hypothetical protein R3E73_03530 [Porticoccaceae bacterium]